MVINQSGAKLKQCGFCRGIVENPAGIQRKYYCSPGCRNLAGRKKVLHKLTEKYFFDLLLCIAKNDSLQAIEKQFGTKRTRQALELIKLSGGNLESIL